ncbi:hypothetical protein BCR44DRAFT_1428378 [Catenaria anguillulae PL171]|uniref:Uncharacterized protein n=1 Tax=Catenaria anguillulae PL171 TaxID=765915 RepID=A0A1Y2HV61_9FUNG|nr:hypothetical protein BCR44DRAFT_1428378 [Catenaria anguillulae PL171]
MTSRTGKTEIGCRPRTTGSGNGCRRHQGRRATVASASASGNGSWTTLRWPWLKTKSGGKWMQLLFERWDLSLGLGPEVELPRMEAFVEPELEPEPGRWPEPELSIGSRGKGMQRGQTEQMQTLGTREEGFAIADSAHVGTSLGQSLDLSNRGSGDRS